MKRLFKTSTHAFGDALKSGKQGPVRGFTIGRFVITWDGKPGDYMETISTDELFGDQ